MAAFSSRTYGPLGLSPPIRARRSVPFNAMTPKSIVSSSRQRGIGNNRQMIIANGSSGKPLDNLFRNLSLPGFMSTSKPKAAPEPAPGPQRDYLETRQTFLKQLFDGREFMFDIPMYQRPYSWEPKHVRELLLDFYRSYVDQEELFIGSIVTTKAADGVYQVIDGQQRLTTLVMLLAYVKHWAKAQKRPDLVQRMDSMLYIGADPLVSSSASRYRLQLRPSDHPFFEANVLASFRPIQFRRAGLLATGEPAVAPASADDGAGNHRTEQQPLENEVWWRLQENAGVIAEVLDDLVAAGTNLQAFTSHCLTKCCVVTMTCRDEAAAFRIFSSLNARGMNLTLVDKLKADLLQALAVSQQQEVADRWAHWEGKLTRAQFDRLFSCVKEMHGAVSPDAAGEGLQEYFVRRAGNTRSTQEVLGLLMVYADILLQLRAGSLFSPAAATATPPAPETSTQATTTTSTSNAPPDESSTAAASSMPEPSTSAEPPGLGTSAMTGEEVRREGSRVLFFLNTFSDDLDDWLPWALEFCKQVVDPTHRLRFLRQLEALQLFLELTQADPAQRQARWQPVGAALSQASSGLDPVWQATALTAEEAATFDARLQAKELAATAPQRLLKHLLLRAEDLPSYDQVTWDNLHVERIVPITPPEGSQWRKTKLPLPPNTPLTPPPMLSTTESFDEADINSPDGQAGSLPSLSEATDASETQPHASTSSSGSLPSAAGAVSRSSAAGTFKYWFDLSRTKLGSQLGNLVLLQYAGVERQADLQLVAYDDKVEVFRSCGAAAFPRFTGGLLPEEAYGHYKFSGDECRQRNADLLEALRRLFALCGAAVSS